MFLREKLWHLDSQSRASGLQSEAAVQYMEGHISEDRQNNGKS